MLSDVNDETKQSDAVGVAVDVERKPAKAAVMDFDCTLTKAHTFHKSKLELQVTDNFQALIEQGYDDALTILKEGDVLTNLKQGIPENLYAMTDDHVCAIATFHNNPDFVAGYFMQLSKLEKKNIPTMVGTIFDKKYPIAINVYYINALSKPLYVCYIPGIEAEFDRRVRKLNGKNEMIAFIERVWKEKGLFQGGDIDFYDDTLFNISMLNKGDWAEKLKHVNAFHVERKNDHFHCKEISRHSMQSRDPGEQLDTPRLYAAPEIKTAETKAPEKPKTPEPKLGLSPDSVGSDAPHSPRTPRAQPTPPPSPHTPTALLQVPAPLTSRQSRRDGFFPFSPPPPLGTEATASASSENQTDQTPTYRVSVDLSDDQPQTKNE